MRTHSDRIQAETALNIGVSDPQPIEIFKALAGFQGGDLFRPLRSYDFSGQSDVSEAITLEKELLEKAALASRRQRD